MLPSVGICTSCMIIISMNCYLHCMYFSCMIYLLRHPPFNFDKIDFYCIVVMRVVKALAVPEKISRGGVGVRRIIVFAWGEAYLWKFYYVNIINFHFPGGGSGPLQPPSRFTHVLHVFGFSIFIFIFTSYICCFDIKISINYFYFTQTQKSEHTNLI